MDRDLLKFIRNTIEEGKEAFEDGKSAFDASRESSKERRIKEESDEPIAFVFPNQEEIPENLRKHFDHVANVMADLFGKSGSNVDLNTSDKHGVEDVELESSETYVGDLGIFDGKLSNFALYEGKHSFTLLVPTVGFREEDISIKFFGDDLIIHTDSASSAFNPTGYRMVAGTMSDLVNPIRVRLSMPDVDHEKTTFNLTNGLLTVELFKTVKTTNVFIVK